MTLGQVRSSLRQPAVVTVAMALAAGLAVRAQQPAPSPPAGQPPASVPTAPTPPSSAQTPRSAPTTPAGPVLSLTADAGFVIFTVRAEGALDFEAFFAKVKEALEQGTKPEYKEMAAGWKLFKIAEAPQSGQVMYASVMDPAVKGADYDPVKLLLDVFPAAATALFPKLKDALISVNRLNLQTILGMGRAQCVMPRAPCFVLGAARGAQQ